MCSTFLVIGQCKLKPQLNTTIPLTTHTAELLKTNNTKCGEDVKKRCTTTITYLQFTEMSTHEQQRCTQECARIIYNSSKL